MGRLILVRKIYNTDSIFYYAIYEEDSIEEIVYYMGLDRELKKINFFLDENFENPFSTYNVNMSKFEKEPEKYLKTIKIEPTIKAIRAIKNNIFPDDLSFQS